MNALLFKFKFDDFDEFAEQIAQSDIEHAQLKRGKFNGTLTQIVHRQVIIGMHRMNQTILQQGIGSLDYTTFIIPGNMEQDFTWRKQRIKGYHLGILKDGREHNCITLPNFFGMRVSIRNDYLFELLNRPEYKSLYKLIMSKEVITDALPSRHKGLNDSQTYITFQIMECNEVFRGCRPVDGYRTR